ncbi:hypothetical protein KHU50_004773 [Colletotrichum sp. SAR 10_65]|nr:hypothetical protein KHU50_004773 [Colletotrichum sp. SAR 10_65]KAI8177811.1 hypothetical protein K4K51_005164 [Colletotrichum sp. SAR 10_75]
MENFQDIVDAIRQAAEVLSQHPDDIDRQQALERAIDVAEEALQQLAPVSAGSLQNVNQIIDCTDRVLSVLPDNHEYRTSLLGELSYASYQRFLKMGPDRNVSDLNRAVQLAEEGVLATSTKTIGRICTLSNLSAILQNRFDHMSDVQDIKRSIAMGEEAVNMIQEGWPHKALILRKLAVSHAKLFEHTHDLDVAERARATAECALETATSLGDAEGVAFASNFLARILGVRSEHTGDTEDLNRAIDLLIATAPQIPKDDKNYVLGLGYLSTFLGNRFMEQGDMGDINVSIEIAERVLQLSSNDHCALPRHLHNLASRLCERAQFTGGLDDFNEAIKNGRQALRLTPPNHPDRITWISGLSQFLGMRFRKEPKKLQDIEEAIFLGREAFQAVDRDDMWRRPHLANNLSIVLKMKYQHDGEAASLDEAIVVLEQVLQVILRCWTEISADLDYAVGLLNALSPRHMQNVNKQQMLKDFVGLGAGAAAAALNARKEASYALQQLELGRGIISGLVLDLRTDLSFLREEHLELADQLSKLRDILDSGPTTLSLTGSLEPGTQARRRAEKDYKSLLTIIRSKKGFERFLMPPTVENLMEAAEQDPAVVVNVSDSRCDAFIVEKNRIRLLELPNLTQRDILANVKRLKDYPASLPSILEWLWSSTVRPILDALGFNRPLAPDDASWPHIWWIPVGPLNSLPLHAAGYHTKRSGETALDRVMSSYSSSIKSLLAGRRQSMPQYDSGPINVLLVAMNITPNRTPLPYAEREVAMLKDLCPALDATPIQPVQHKEDILTELSRCDIFHFAGHGTSNASDPSLSALLLRDWEESPLTVEDLRNKRLQEKPPFLAYLSACSTGANEALGLVDEGIHLGYACQLAGFRHVVGTLWTVADPVCVYIAQKFYKNILDEGKTDAAVRRGLHLALRELRDLEISINPHGARTNTVEAPDDEGEEMAAPGREDGNGNEDGIDEDCIEQRSRPRKGVGVGKRPQPSMNSLWVPFVHFGV